jgi:putative transposase
MALWQRKPEAVIHHSDQGTQYTSIAFGLRCKEAGVRPSMGSVGDAYDNALCESFFATLECELLERKRFRNQAEAKMAIFDFIEGFYNPHRRPSGTSPRSTTRGGASLRLDTQTLHRPRKWGNSNEIRSVEGTPPTRSC